MSDHHSSDWKKENFWERAKVAAQKEKKWVWVYPCFSKACGETDLDRGHMLTKNHAHIYIFSFLKKYQHIIRKERYWVIVKVKVHCCEKWGDRDNDLRRVIPMQLEAVSKTDGLNSLHL